MNENNASVVVASLPSDQTAIVSSKGNTLGVRYFVGGKSAKELKETLRLSGLKGRKLTNAVNEALRSESANMRVRTLGAVQALHERGFVADTVDVKSKAATVKFVKVAEEKPAKAITAAKAEAKAATERADKAEAFLAALAETLKGMGLDADEIVRNVEASKAKAA